MEMLKRLIGLEKNGVKVFLTQEGIDFLEKQLETEQQVLVVNFDDKQELGGVVANG